MREEVARKFHDTYERLAPEYGYETRKDTKKFDPKSANGKLMAAVCEEVCGPLIEALTRLTCLGNGPIPGNSDGNVIAQDAIKKFRDPA